MHRPDHLVRVRHALDQLAHGFGVLEGNGIANGIRHVDGLGPGLDDRFENPTQEVDLGAPGILGRKLDVIRVLTRPANRLDRLLDHLIGGHAELLFHMNRRGGNEGMNPPRIGRLDRLARPRDIVFIGARQRTHGGILDGLGNGVDRIEVARRGRRETGLDHIDAHLFKLAGNTQLFFLGHRGARALLAVAQGRIKNDEMLLHENTPTIRPACA